MDLREPTNVVLDLRTLIFIGPTCLALLTAVVKGAKEDGTLEEGRLRLPDARSMGDYLERMGFVQLLTGRAQDDHADLPAGSRSCRHFEGEDCHEVAYDLASALAEICDMDGLALLSVHICLSELAENVIHHAEAPLGGYAAAGGWSRSQDLEIGIVDLGIGIRGSLTKNPRYADIHDDVLAITTAQQKFVTATPDRNAGIGLFVTKELLRANGGFVLTRSGNAAVYTGAREGEYVREEVFPGTVVALRARTDRPLNINEQVYDRLEHPDLPSDLA